VFFLGDREIAVLTKDSVRVTDFDGNVIEPKQQRITWDPIMAEKGGFKHFMLKEIYEQPRCRPRHRSRPSLARHRQGLSRPDGYCGGRFPLADVDQDRRVRYKLARRTCGQVHDRKARAGSVEVDYASEFRYRDPVLTENDLLIVISQSGETADTIAAMREAKASRMQSPRGLQRSRIDDPSRS
jgi:glucosamine--fructose-6-phosphate aminotransferase (isomerizing)